MITEDYVSFETAKLLKEKGYWNMATMLYKENGDIVNYNVPLNNKGFSSTLGVFYEAPTLQMAMKWLRKEKNLCIEPYRTACGYLSTISKIPTGSELYAQEYEGNDEDSGQFTTYEKSCEAAIKYCLEKLL